MKNQKDVDTDLSTQLELLRHTPERNPQRAAHGRARFLTQAAQILPPVSNTAKQRLMNWRPISRKGRFMMNAVIAAVVAFVLLVSGGATVAAAQDDLPNQALYPVKTLTEDVRLWLNTDPNTEMDMLMELVQLRIEEMIVLQAEGQVPPARVTERLELHIQQALQVAVGMDPEAMQGALLRIHTELQLHEMVMQVLRTQSSGDQNHVITQTATMLENRIRMVEEGIADPQGFQNTVRTEQELHTGQEGEPPYQNQASGTPSTGQNGGQNTGTQQVGTGTPKAPNYQGTPGPHGTGTNGTNRP